MTECKGCGIQVHGFARCPSCMKKHTFLRKYKRRHEHRKKMIK